MVERAPLDVERLDLAKAFPHDQNAGASGFRTIVPLVGSEPLELFVEAVLADDTRRPLARIQAVPRIENGSALAAVVSVIVTAAAGDEDTLPATLDSVLAQTYPKFEVILAASGLTDADKFASVAREVILFTEPPNSSQARNAALKVARGSIAVFLEAGERLLPDALKTALGELRAHPTAVMVAGKCAVTRPYHDDPVYPQQPFVGSHHYRALLTRNVILTPAVAAVRRAAIEALGGFDETLETLADYELYLRLARSYPISLHTRTVAESPAVDPVRTDPAASAAALRHIFAVQQESVRDDARLAPALEAGRKAWADRYGIDLADVEGKQSRSKHTRKLLPRLDTAHLSRTPLPGDVEWGDLRRTSPLSRNFGFDRGTPVDRYYIESFLADHAEDIRGHVLEVQENDYTIRFGGERVEVSDVLSLLPDNPKATLIGDLADPQTIPAASMDTAIITQVLHLIREPRRAAESIYRCLRPGGVALVTVPGISQVEWSETWHWSFTAVSAQETFATVFAPGNVTTRSYGNVLAATSFLMGIAQEELEPAELDVVDLDYPVVVAVRAVKRASR